MTKTPRDRLEVELALETWFFIFLSAVFLFCAMLFGIAGNGYLFVVAVGMSTFFGVLAYGADNSRRNLRRGRVAFEAYMAEWSNK